MTAVLTGAGCGNEDPAGPAATGSLTVTVTAEGASIDTDGLVVVVDGTAAGPVAPGAPLTVSELAGGAYEVALSGLATNCAVAGGASRTVDVTSDSRAQVAFALNCRAVLRDAIVFTSERDGNAEIYAMGSDGRNPVNLTNNPGKDHGPAVSPDGTRIAFGSDRTGAFQIWVMDADGSNPVQLTFLGVGDSYPSWSPDGSRIAFVTQRTGQLQIFVMNSDGSDARNISTGIAYNPSWSPDGSLIAYFGPLSISVMRPDGTNARQLIQLPDNVFPDGHPVGWSPDGSTLVVGIIEDVVPFKRDIYAFDATGGNLRNITASPDGASKPAFAGSSDEILFVSNFDIHKMKLDGTGLTNLTVSAGLDLCYPQAWAR